MLTPQLPHPPYALHPSSLARQPPPPRHQGVRAVRAPRPPTPPPLHSPCCSHRPPRAPVRPERPRSCARRLPLQRVAPIGTLAALSSAAPPACDPSSTRRGRIDADQHDTHDPSCGSSQTGGPARALQSLRPQPSQRPHMRPCANSTRQQSDCSCQVFCLRGSASCKAPYR
eukprot:scaffold64818_cov72-Phaeocystis_antarctica.AAC.4